jgi:hypothetical protein
MTVPAGTVPLQVELAVWTEKSANPVFNGLTLSEQLNNGTARRTQPTITRRRTGAMMVALGSRLIEAKVPMWTQLTFKRPGRDGLTQYWDFGLYP